MAKMTRCCVCGSFVDMEIVHEDFEEYFAQADALGMESLTEHQQIAVEGLVCSFDCYLQLD